MLIGQHGVERVRKLQIVSVGPCAREQRLQEVSPYEQSLERLQELGHPRCAQLTCAVKAAQR